MSPVRPFVEADIPAVADLHRRVFHTEAAAGEGWREAYRAYFGEVFLNNPLGGEGLTSFVYEDRGGGIVGFLGVMPRRMWFRGQPVLAAVCSQFAVDPSRRGRVGLQMLKHCFAGPQDLCLTDESGDDTRKIWEWCGGTSALPYSMHWVRPLRPARAALAHLGRGSALRAAAAPAAWLADALLGRLSRNPFRVPAPAGSRHELDEATLLACLPEFAAPHALHPEHDDRTVKWTLERAAHRSGYGPLRKMLVRDAEGAVTGWYLYHAPRGEIGHVLQIAARAHAGAQVLDHLVEDAFQQGAIALSGRLEPAFAQALSEKGCLLYRRGYWTLIQSRRPELLHAIQRGDAFLSRLDGEWPLRFQ